MLIHGVDVSLAHTDIAGAKSLADLKKLDIFHGNNEADKELWEVLHPPKAQKVSDKADPEQDSK